MTIYISGVSQSYLLRKVRSVTGKASVITELIVAWQAGHAKFCVSTGIHLSFYARAGTESDLEL